ncbi:MAG TPA: hypothetical protein VFR07_06710 [Mycobacteriales bacterium]|jgi:hypothetical protein|nr:hypothetical protein [Mycobacteriales bacterium]
MAELLTRRAALHAGRPVREVDALVRSGRWQAVRRGVYWTAPQLPTAPELRAALLVQAAVLSSGVPSVGSHESAALVHGLPLFVHYTGDPLLSRLRATGKDRPDARLCASLVSQVPPEHRCQVHGAEVTTAARTAVDLARTRPRLTAVVVLDAALAAGVSRPELLAVLDRQRGWPGVAYARQRLAFADGRAESPLESIGRLRFAQLELPAPDLQVVLGGQWSVTGRVDFLWRAQRTVGEADGRVKYGGPEDDGTGNRLFEEKRREDAIRDDGFEVFRFTWDEAVHRPELLRDRALRAFARGARHRP